jgi:predicted LPLAT superfamily acyltransferase
MRGLYRLLGRRLSSALMWPIALYFTVVGREHRRAHRRYIEALRSTPRGRDVGPPHFGSALAHVHAFAINLFDRMVAWGGGLDDIRFIHQGSEHLFRLAEEKRGAILIGSHLGSFDMMRLLAGRHGLVVNVLMFTKNAERITAFLHNLDPESRVRVIALDPSSMRTAFEIKQCLDRGEFVGILGDRIWPADRAHRELLPFFGQPAPFSLRPFLLAGVLGAPLLFAVCVRRGPSTYEAAVEVLHPGGQVPRAAREARAREWLQGYVASLEHWCGEEPLQWFNFYDTWQVEDA